MGDRQALKLIENRKERREALERLPLFKSTRAVIEVAEDFIVDAEDTIQGLKAGRRRLDATSTALAQLIDIPIVPEFVEVLIARVVVQVVFSIYDEVDHLVAKVKARRASRQPRSL